MVKAMYRFTPNSRITVIYGGLQLPKYSILGTYFPSKLEIKFS